jgi:ribosomal protein L3 glutamine methyltransferase
MQPIAELRTIRDFIRWTVSRFNEAGLYFGHGTENALDEAIALILHTLYLPHELNQSLLDARLTSDEKEKLYHLIQRRIKEHIPVPYLTHEAFFAGLSFYVDERVIIPRSPLAELIENQFKPWDDSESVHHILDLCTGSGCIAIASAKAFPNAHVTASDISVDALSVAKINMLRHQVEDQVELCQSDLFASLPKRKYDIIVSNPPYVDSQDMAALPKEYSHEPKIALAGGKEGLDFALKILKNAHHYLKPHGILVVEVGNSETALSERFPTIPFTWLTFERGGGGVFLLTAEQVMACQASYEVI